MVLYSLDLYQIKFPPVRTQPKYVLYFIKFQNIKDGKRCQGLQKNI